jgi:hypothetical protein
LILLTSQAFFAELLVTLPGLRMQLLEPRSLIGIEHLDRGRMLSSLEKSGVRLGLSYRFRVLLKDGLILSP